jgi:hypothetical protein
MGRHPVADGTLILRVGLVAALLFAALLLASWAIGFEVDPDTSAGPARGVPVAADSGRVAVLGNLDDARVTESSGVAVSHRQEGLLWTHNDAPGELVLHAIGMDGAWRGAVTVEGVEGQDWEDLALAPCPAGGGTTGDCLWVADIGDNEADRESVSVHAVPEPEPSAGSVRAVASVTFRYPEGPADAEALAVRPDGDLLVVTKGEDGSARLYRVAWPGADFGPEGGADPGAGDGPDGGLAGGSGDGSGAGPARGAAVAELLASLPLDVGRREDRITGAATSPDGSTLAVRSHVAIHLFPLDRPGASPVTCQIGDLQPQGEAVDFVDDSTLVLTSEAPSGPAPILRVRCP